MVTSPLTPRALFIAACGLLLGAAGCGAKASAIALGAIAVGGKPAAGVYVVLSPTDATKKDATRSGRTEAGGQFVIEVPEPGEYALTLFWPKVTEVLGETIEGDDQFKGRHRDAQNPVSKVNLLPGDNTIPPVDLKRP